MKKRAKRSRTKSAFLRLKSKILKKLKSIEETPANAAKIRGIENRLDELTHKYKRK